MGKRHIHDMCDTKLYKIWNSIKGRCSGKSDELHNRNYYQRGITVCDEWKEDFLSFYHWSIENGYRDGLTIDRIDNNGNYEPGNCQWITHKQNNNKRGNNVWIEYNNEIHTKTEWADLYNISVDTLDSRLKRGWNFDKALNEPIKNTGRRCWK